MEELNPRRFLEELIPRFLDGITEILEKEREHFLPLIGKYFCSKPPLILSQNKFIYNGLITDILFEFDPLDVSKFDLRNDPLNNTIKINIEYISNKKSETLTISHNLVSPSQLKFFDDEESARLFAEVNDG